MPPDTFQLQILYPQMGYFGILCIKDPGSRGPLKGSGSQTFIKDHVSGRSLLTDGEFGGAPSPGISQGSVP